MKLTLKHLILGAAIFTGATGVARAQVSSNDAVRVEVRPQTESEHKDIKGATVDTVTQGKTLQIILSGKPKDPETRTGKWKIYGRDMKDHDLMVLASGDFKIEFVRGSQTVSSTKATATYTPQYTPVTANRGNARGGRTAPAAKKVEATGTKYAGYSVTIYDGDKVAGSAADPSGIEKEANK